MTFALPSQLRREDVDGALAEIILHVPREADDADVVAPELLQMRLRFVVHGADEPQLRVLQLQPMPGFEQVMDALALDERAGKDGAEKRRALARPEAVDVHAARQIEELLFRESLDAKRLGRLLREHDEQIGELVFLDVTLARQQQSSASRSASSPAALAVATLRTVLPRSRCQVGISTIDGMPRRLATRSDSRQSPDQLWKRS